MEGTQQPEATSELQRNWLPWLVGLAAVVIAVAAIWFFTRHQGAAKPESSEYAQQLKLSAIRLSAAENYMGGTVTYLDFNVTNAGDKALVGAEVHAEFKNSMAQVVQKETLPLHVLVENQLAGYPDLVDMSRAPILPGQTKTVRVTVEHISNDWDQTYPQMELVNLKLK
jgi:hypothetical protein